MKGSDTSNKHITAQVINKHIILLINGKTEKMKKLVGQENVGGYKVLLLSWLSVAFCHCFLSWTHDIVTRKLRAESQPNQPPAPAGGKCFVYTLTQPTPFTPAFTLHHCERWGVGGKRKKKRKEEVFITRVKRSLPGMGVGEEKVEELVAACLRAWLPIQTYFPRPQRQDSLFPEAGTDWARQDQISPEYPVPQHSKVLLPIVCPDQPWRKARLACSRW